MKPLLSVIIPVYNRAKIVGETLDSILKQTYENWECLLIDDESEDNTFYVIQKYQLQDPRFRCYKRPNDFSKGPNGCRNYGFTKAKGDIINFFDSDDLYYPDAFQLVVDIYDEEKDAVVVNSEIRQLSDSSLIRSNEIFTTNIIEDYFVGKITFLVSGPFWKMSFLKKQEYLFDEGIRNIDDWDFNIRMLYQRPKIAYIQKPLIIYRKHDESFSEEIKKLNIIEISSDFKARKKHLSLIKEITEIDKKRIQKFLINRYKKFIRLSISRKSDMKTSYFIVKRILEFQLKFGDIFGFLKTIFSYLIFRITGRGYNLFKT